MIAKPEAGKEVLCNHHSQSYHYGVGDAQFVITAQPVATEDGAADDRLQQIVGETHTAEDAKMVEYAAYALEGIPCGDYS